ncbi:uncharacterized protein LOC127567526 isoform X5 [Pristis pectinata]|nr:uncharacterized protein LOC127567526 isoform X5 [Pristis pectinata]XP_051866494.1 uncharacterized protein LOC127567526 isoform X5 [Pristis pectinata]XP_051866495.1 uncharacterized protein LOC127567526 isoform X5 [Pristis pectinata]XP_051866496.1 uncharacterized protein LOC127567526 isoform X5 [Pristis pectinata]XP_051866498.1 uncharacterized protein LOC127567526 isoform X5 [Pristis pectinata]
MELVSKADWKDLLMKFICISCIQVGAVIFFHAITEVSKPDWKNLLKLSINIGYIQIPFGISFLLVTELISQIDWEELLKTFINTSCIQVEVGFFFLVLIESKSKTAQRNLLQIFIQTNCMQVGAGFLFLVQTELVSNSELHELIIRPNIELASRLHDMWISDWKKLLQTFINTNCVQIGAGFFFLVLTELASETGSTWANFQILFLKWTKWSTEYTTEL